MSPIEVRNPRTGKLDYVIIPPPPKLLAQKCNRLRRGQLQWQSLGLEGRIEIIQAFQAALTEVRPQLIDAVVADTGRLALSTWEVDTLIANIDRCCQLAYKLIRDRDLNTTISYIHLWQTATPYQLVGIISPYTFPLLLATIEAIPALIAGCAVVVKPSELTPRFIAPLTNALNNVPILRDVLTFVEGDGKTGAALLESIDLVCFTGSLDVGRVVAEIAAAQFIPAYLELGGKNPAIVLESADIDLATSAILTGACFNAGQSCDAISRIYVAETIFDEFYHQLVAKANQLQFTNLDLETGHLGPIINYKQAQIITKQLEQAQSQGAMIHCGAELKKLDGGLWCPPTVITQVNPTMDILTTETLAPIMPVIAIANPEAAINFANDSVYGRVASIFADTETTAMELAPKLEFGTILINDVLTTQHIFTGERQPWKFSGNGQTVYSTNIFSKFLRSQSIFRKTKSIPSPWWLG
ncbi:aldehyde dehydrogenase family protein [Calothrix sp. NIES-3974]|uniref:aldehyde dehydrogenase family protein n=1 Tax=Calothrix sp. NIES-3974 TaxID=2005462 RepID=UPI000B5F6914|nr:aldehyde dehydrogenase family protein [Calothrix sp. NIES-3974]BAZ04047.1 aldehyde dehydrogenase [Calothrix sp. NIES-3974]